MTINTFGRILRFTTWGESHGPAIGVVVDGVPPQVRLDEAVVQRELDRRRPGTSRYVTQRREPDTVKIVSGLYPRADGAMVTTGTPVSMIIENVDQRSGDYSDLADVFRPGHADYTYLTKYGIRDPRGGGRSSARETACRVAAGAVAKQLLGDIAVRCAVVSVGGHQVDRKMWDWDQVGSNPFFCPDPSTVPQWAKLVDDARKCGSSLGAVLEVVAEGVPAGWGAPIYAKLDSDIAAALMGINAVKAVEIGDGFAAAANTGEQNADEMFPSEVNNNGVKPSVPSFGSNHAGGILGGISSGQPIVARFAVKPTSSIRTERDTVDSDGIARKVSTKGRHDPCVGLRAAPIAEAMVAFVLADHMLLHRAQCSTAE